MFSKFKKIIKSKSFHANRQGKKCPKVKQIDI